MDNNLRCFSMKDGDILWTVPTQLTIVRSQKKQSIVIVSNLVIFSNSIGDLTAVDINTGELIWQTPTQSNEIFLNAFSLENSEMILNKDK